MLFNYKSNIILTFFKEEEDGGEPKPARVTLSNVRKDLTATEINQIAEAFKSLIMHSLGEVELVQYSYVEA